MAPAGFGKWYDEQKTQEAGDSGTSSSWFGSTEVLPLFENAEMPSFGEMPTFQGMKASMEAQLPQKVMGMNYQQRFQMFCALLFLSALFFALAFFVGLPMVAMRPQKFALSFTFGSLTFMASFGILKGPIPHLTGMFARDRIIFTIIYLASMMMTLHFTFNAGGAKGYLLVLSASGAQLISLLWYLISFLPGGSAGLGIVLRAMAQILKPFIVGCAKVQAVVVGRCLSLWMSSSSS